MRSNLVQNPHSGQSLVLLRGPAFAVTGRHGPPRDVTPRPSSGTIEKVDAGAKTIAV